MIKVMGHILKNPLPNPEGGYWLKVRPLSAREMPEAWWFRDREHLDELLSVLANRGEASLQFLGFSAESQDPYQVLGWANERC